MRRPALAIIAAAALVPAVPATAQAACTAADRHPDEASVKQLRAATVCLLNAERRKAGRKPLKANGSLALAGQRHARDMVRRRYFAHDSLGGRSFKSRILRAGYVHRGASALIGENLAWGAGRGATPRSIVRGWMKSPGHRRNVLNATFREVGIGVVRAAPRALDGAATYAAEFGRTY